MAESRVLVYVVSDLNLHSHSHRGMVCFVEHYYLIFDNSSVFKAATFIFSLFYLPNSGDCNRVNVSVKELNFVYLVNSVKTLF